MPTPTDSAHMADSTSRTGMSRRRFMQATAAAASTVALVRPVWANLAPSETINVAFIGVGRQGKILLNYLLEIPGVRIQSICDIWSYSKKLGKGLVARQNNPEVTVYDDYQEMLATENGLDAAIIATPDFVHAPMTNACLEAGLHVYCEKEMSNTLEAAAGMVRTARKTGKLLQIGHQRRSNPFYQHARNLMYNDKFCGQVTTVNGQWNQLKPLRPLPAKMLSKYSIPTAVLEQHGYGSMAEFYDWRWFKKFAGGPMTDLGSHQLDVYNWYLDAPPKAVVAFGDAKHAIAEAKANDVGYVPECFDHTIAFYDYDSPAFGEVSATYQVILTSSYGGFYEVFMGDTGSIRISEIREKSLMVKERVAEALAWEDQAEQVTRAGETGYAFDPLKTRKAKGQTAEQDPGYAALADKLEKATTKVHILHLENFFETIRGEAELTCPAEIGYETAVTVLKANEAAMTGKKIEFQPSDFVVA